MEPELPEIRDLAMDTPLPAVVPVRCAVDIDEIETELFGQLHVELGVTEINGSAATLRATLAIPSRPAPNQ